MKKLLLTMLLLLAAVALIAQGAFELGDKTPYTITPKAAQQQSTGQLEGITEPYEFEIGKCQAMFAERMREIIFCFSIEG